MNAVERVLAVSVPASGSRPLLVSGAMSLSMTGRCRLGGNVRNQQRAPQMALDFHRKIALPAASCIGLFDKPISAAPFFVFIAVLLC